MSVKDKLARLMKTRKTPMTAQQIAERMACSHTTALRAMNDLIKEGVVKEVMVAVKNKYAKGIL